MQYFTTAPAKDNSFKHTCSTHRWSIYLSIYYYYKTSSTYQDPSLLESFCQLVGMEFHNKNNSDLGMCSGNTIKSKENVLVDVEKMFAMLHILFLTPCWCPSTYWPILLGSIHHGADLQLPIYLWSSILLQFHLLCRQRDMYWVPCNRGQEA